jgi:hypothetical protein
MLLVLLLMLLTLSVALCEVLLYCSCCTAAGFCCLAAADAADAEL